MTFSHLMKSPLMVFFPPLLVVALLSVSGDESASLEQLLLAVPLTCIPWWSYLYWRIDRRSLLPLFGMVSATFWLYYVLPVFWDDHSIRMLRILDVPLSEEALTKSLAIVLLGVGTLALGMQSGLGQRLAPRARLDLTLGDNSRKFVRVVLIIGTVIGFFPSLPSVLGSSLRQVLIIVQMTIPSVAFVILLRYWFRGESVTADRVVLVAFLLARIVTGISSGWVGALVTLALACGVTHLVEKRTLPVLPILIVAVAVLFFQAGKDEFRRTYWYGAESGGVLDRTISWVNSSSDEWAYALEDGSGERVRRLIFKSLTRVSLLAQTANVVELTPNIVPHQGSAMYKYLLVTFIPRAVWPNKPSINEANRFYQTAYGMTSEENLEGVSISVGSLAEAYIAYGWLGVAIVPFLLGILFGFFQKVFLSRGSGMLFGSIGIVLTLQLIVIESQLAQYVSGLLQQVVITLAVMYPFLRVVRPLGDSSRLEWKNSETQYQY